MNNTRSVELCSLADSASLVQPVAAVVPVVAHAKPEAVEEKKHKKKHKKRSSKHSHGEGSKTSDGEKVADERSDLSSSLTFDPQFALFAEAAVLQWITRIILPHLLPPAVASEKPCVTRMETSRECRSGGRGEQMMFLLGS